MRSLVRWVVWILPLGVLGCASDPRATPVNNVISYLDSATGAITEIRESVDESIKKQANKKLNAEELKKCHEAVEKLKNLSKDMQKAKQQIDLAAGSTTPEQRDDLKKQFQGKLSGAMENIQKERLELEKSIAAAEAIDFDSMKELRSKLTEAEGFFVQLARQR